MYRKVFLTAQAIALIQLASSQVAASSLSVPKIPLCSRASTSIPVKGTGPAAESSSWAATDPGFKVCFRAQAEAKQVPRSSHNQVPSAVQAPAPASPVGNFTLRAEVNLVVIEATVRDQYRGVVDNLARRDFRLYEDGIEQQIVYFSRDELPLALALVVDRSGSMGPVLRQLRRVAYDTLSLLKPGDEVALFDFAARTDRLEDLTADRKRIADRIARIHAAGATVITDALSESAVYLGRAAPDRRHAIILVSDNSNTLEGYSTEKRVVREALETEAVIYGIRVAGGSHPRLMNVLLPVFRNISVEEMTHDTGGEVIDAEGVKAVRSALATVISRLKQRYTVGYYSTNRGRPGTFRQIEIRVAEPPNGSGRKYNVYARRGYYVRPEHPTSLDAQP